MPPLRLTLEIPQTRNKGITPELWTNFIARRNELVSKFDYDRTNASRGSLAVNLEAWILMNFFRLR